MPSKRRTAKTFATRCASRGRATPCADERRALSHLGEWVEVAAARRQHLLAALQVNCSGLVVAREVADRSQVDHDRAVYLRELGGIEPGDEVLEGCADQGLSRLTVLVAPRDQRVLRFGA